MIRRPAARTSLQRVALPAGVLVVLLLAVVALDPGSVRPMQQFARAAPAFLGGALDDNEAATRPAGEGAAVVDERASMRDASTAKHGAADADEDAGDGAITASPLVPPSPPPTAPPPTAPPSPPPPSAIKKSKKKEWTLQPRVVEFGNASSELPPILVAYCDYDAARQWFHSNNYQEFLVEWMGPHLWPSRKVIVRNVYAKPRHLPSTVDVNSPDALDLLGITNTHLRICYFGNTEIIAHMTSLPNIAIDSVPAKDVEKRMRDAGLQTEALKQRVYFTSSRVQLILNMTTRMPFGPLLFRRSQETFGTGVHGVPVQIETKWHGGPGETVVIYLPFLVDSFAWRWKNPNRAAGYWENRVGAGFATMREAVTRPADYVAKVEHRPFFIASLVSHCEGNPFIPVREAFTFAVHQVTGKPVYNLGACPDSDDGALLAGVTVAERAAMRARFKGSSALEVFANFKFAIVFENSFNRGYFTEKILNAYGARAVPVYYSETYEDLAQVINPKAIIYCHMPRNVTDWHALEAFRKKTCADHKFKDETAQCSRVVRVAYKERYFPYFAACARKVQAMDEDDALYLDTLSQPLAVIKDNGELGDMWSGAILASFFRALLWGLGYVDK